MSKLTDRRVVLITRPTRLDNILAKENTISQARFKLASMNVISKTFSSSDDVYTELDAYEMEHNQYKASIRTVQEAIESLAPLQMLDRKYLSNFVFNDSDIIVCIGQDGLVANTLKYLNSQPVIGINPDKKAYDGVLLPFEPKDSSKILKDVVAGKRKHKNVSMGELRFPDGQRLLAVNDFFIGQRGHTSARYIIKYAGLKEPQSSSGIIISTGMGSTGWMQSVIAGAKGVSSFIIGSPAGLGRQNKSLMADDIDIDEEVMEMCAPASVEMPVEMMEAEPPARKQRLSGHAPVPAAPLKKIMKKEYGGSDLSAFVGKWDSRELYFAVREPFPSKTSGTGIVFGRISEGENLRVESLMGENGVIFSDGVESDFLEFNSGMEATIGISDNMGIVII
jgi:NAD kinase